MSSQLRRGSSRHGPSEASENGLLQASHSSSNHLTSFPPPRSPLASIPDPSQQIHSTVDGSAVDSPSKLSHTASPAAESTPSRTVSRVSTWRNVDRGTRERGSTSCRALRGGAVDTVFGNVGPATCFELEGDPLFWRDQNVQVLIRIRPANCLESHGRCVRQESSRTLTWAGHPETRFTFDNIACESTSQEKLFMAVGLPMVENCLSGYNSCMFAYGQTGSGKTYTMLGEIVGGTSFLSKDCGMIPRIFEYLFTRIHEEEYNRSNDKLKYNCKCSFLEIYNEQITDLLDPSATNLQLREDLKKGVHVENLREFVVNSVVDVAELLLQGIANRKVAATCVNSESSRSHCLFTCTIESQWERDGMKHIRYSRLNLVDLAGSERQKNSNVEGERLKEAAGINKSLSTLSLVIMTLVDVASGKQRHIPYRDSKLTFLLQDSLGGNSKTIIIANINPSGCSANETLSTLKFAQRAKLIQNNAKVNEDASGDEVTLQREIQMLKDRLTFLVKNQDIPGNLGINISNVNMVDVGNFQDNHEYSYIVGHPKLVNLNSKIKNADAILIGALRREKMAEGTVRSLEAEIEYMSRLVSEREDDAQRAKMIARLQEEKIKRLKLLADDLISAEDYLTEENNSLSKENQLLREKVSRNPELTYFALENVRLLNQLRKFQEFYQKGEREMLLAEIDNLRSQLLNVFEKKQWQAGCSLKDLNEDSRINQDHLHTSHKMTQKNEYNTVEEVGNFRKRSDAFVKVNTRLTREDKELCCHPKGYSSSTEVAAANFIDKDEDLVKSREENFPDEVAIVANNLENDDEKLVNDHGIIFIENSSLHAKPERMQREHEARIMNRWQYHHATQTSLLHETEEIKNQAEKQDLQEKLEHITQENIRLLEIISAKDAELSSVAIGWEKAIVCLTSFLADGCQSLDDASEQVEHIMVSFPERKAWVREHVEMAMDAFLNKERLISNLQTKLESAQEIGLDVTSKMETLRGATLAITGVQREEYHESEKELQCLRRQLSEKSSVIQNLENLTQYMKNKISKLEKQAIAAFIIIKRLHEMGSVQSLFGNMGLAVVESANRDFGYESTQIQNIKPLLMEVNNKLNHLIAGIGEHHFMDRATDKTGCNHSLAVQIQDEIGNAVYWHPPNQHGSGKVQQASDLLVKFREAQETMKEADYVMNALVELNGKSKQEKHKWEKTSKVLLKEMSALTIETQELRTSASLAEEQNNFLQHQISESLLETMEILSSYEASFANVQDETAKELKIICTNVLSFGKELFQYIGKSRLSIEAMLAKIMEKDFTLSVVYQCYLDKMEEIWNKVQENHKGNEIYDLKVYDKVDISPTFRDVVEENSLDFKVHDGFKLKYMNGINVEAGMAPNLGKNAKSSRSSMAKSAVETDNALLRKEHSQEDVLLKGLYFDLRLLQESASYTNDETEQLFSTLSQVQHDLSNKSDHVDKMLVRQEELQCLLAEREAALINSRSDLMQAEETLSILLNENNELNILVKDFHAKNKDAEQLIQKKDNIIDSLEREILCMNTTIEERILSAVEEMEEELKVVSKERNHLHEEVVYLNDKLEMMRALADENEAIAVEARQDSEASRVHAQQKEEEVRVLESSIQELEETIDILERKVHGMFKEVETHQVVKEGLEKELHELKERMHIIEDASEILESGTRNKIQVPRKTVDMIAEINEARKHIETLELEKEKKVEEIKQYKRHISELVLHSEAQSALYQQRYKKLEAMVHENKSDPLNVFQVASTANRVDKVSSRSRGTGSPFKCITSVIQQMNAEKDQQLSMAQVHIEELERLAGNRQKEVCKLTARLEAVDHMTHDVIRDLLDVKLDMTNYANLLDTNQLLQLTENAQQSYESYEMKDEEIVKLRKDIDGLLDERHSLIEDANQMKAEILSTRVADEGIQRQDQVLIAQNEMLKIDKANLTQKIIELDEMVKNLVGCQSLQDLIQRHTITESNLPRVDDEDVFTRRLAKADNLLTLAKGDSAEHTKTRGT